MMTNIRHHLGIVAALIIASSLVTGALVASAQDAAPGAAGSGAMSDTMFPIAELGNCESKAECRTYCDDADHIDACTLFATAHGLMTKQERVEARKFAAQVKSGSGPGGCTSPSACKAYCEDIAHIEECVQFAEKNNFKGKDVEQGKKLSAFIKTGGKTPGGCSSKQACQQYCSDFSHAEECFTFAKSAGITQVREKARFDEAEDGEEKIPTEEQMKVLAELAKSGDTPGGCTSKDACVEYCHIDAHLDECTAFGVKVGFMTKEEASRAKIFQTSGGPGGCKTPDACHAYCNEDAHHEECFKFAEENGLMPKGELEQVKQGMVRMREGIANAPEEAKECLKNVLGEDALLDLQSGKLAPGPQLGQKMRSCFEQFGGSHDPAEMIKNAPKEVSDCLTQKLGAQLTEVKTGKSLPGTDMADAFRICMQQRELEQGGFGIGSGKQQNIRNMPQPDPGKIRGYLDTAPAEVSACLKEKLAENYEAFISGNMPITTEIGNLMHSCFAQFRPDMENMHGQIAPSGKMIPPTSGQMMPPPSGGMQNRPEATGGIIGNMPPLVVACLKEKLGEDGFVKLSQSAPSQEVVTIIRACITQFSGMPQEGGTIQGGAQPGAYQSYPPTSGGGYPQPGTYPSYPPKDGTMPPPGTYPTTYPNQMPPQDYKPEQYPTQYPSGTADPGTMPPPPPPTTSAPQSRGPARALLLSTVAAPFVYLWDALR